MSSKTLNGSKSRNNFNSSIYVRSIYHKLCYSWFYHTWLITHLWPSMSLRRLFGPHGPILYFYVSNFIPKNTCLLLHMPFNPILAYIHGYWPQTHIHRDVCISPNSFGVFLDVFSNHLSLGLPYTSKIAQIWPSITPLECCIRNPLDKLKRRNWRATKP